MFPNLQYNLHKWPITQHMKLISDGGLYDLLYAAYTYASYNSPSERINEYLVANDIVPPNIRRDSQLSDIWRDYQQVLAELGFMYSTKVTGGFIQPTPCGLNLLDNQSSLREILTGQVLLYQYPNGGKREYANEQISNNVLIRPAILVWRIIDLIRKKGGNPYLTSKEIKDYLMHCTKHIDADLCANAILNFRKTNKGLPPNSLSNAGRNASDWITLLTNTLLFKQTNTGNLKAILLSEYAINNFTELDKVIESLENENSFWNPPFMDDSVRKQWYSFYGALRLDVSLPNGNLENNISENESNDDDLEINFENIGKTDLRKFDSSRLNYNHENRHSQGKTIESSYDADMVANKHRLHDSMIVYIASICSAKGAEVLDDPKSVDLLVRFNNTEYLIEVKTITAQNYIKRLRYAIGQLLHYDFMLERVITKRRKVLAFPALLPKNQDFLTFTNSYLNFDVLSLVPTTEGQILHCNSINQETINLFQQANNI